MLALKTVLTAHGISQAALARMVNLSSSTIAQLLNHEQWPTQPDPQTLKGLITEALADNNITVEAAMFEPVEVEAEASPTNLLLTQEGIDMLLRKQSLSPAAKAQFNLFRDPFANDINEAEIGRAHV